MLLGSRPSRTTGCGRAELPARPHFHSGQSQYQACCSHWQLCLQPQGQPANIGFAPAGRRPVLQGRSLSRLPRSSLFEGHSVRVGGEAVEQHCCDVVPGKHLLCVQCRIGRGDRMSQRSQRPREKMPQVFSDLPSTSLHVVQLG